MGPWPRAEIEVGVRRVPAAGGRGGREPATGRPWADLFTEDAEYIEHLYGTMHGREAIYQLDPGHHVRVPGQRHARVPHRVAHRSTRTGAGWCARCGTGCATPGTAPSTRSTTSPSSSTPATGCGRRRRTSTTRCGSPHAPGLGGGPGRRRGLTGPGTSRPPARAAGHPGALALAAVERRRLGRTGHRSSVADPRRCRVLGLGPRRPPPRPSTGRWPPGSTTSTWPRSTAGPRSSSDR